MDKVINQNSSNLSVIWRRGRRQGLIIFLFFHITFLGFCLKEYLTDIPERYYPISSNIGRFVYFPNFYIHSIIILIFAVFFLFCPTRIFKNISFYFYSIIFIYFMGFFLFFIGSFFGISFFTFYGLLSIPLKEEIA